MNNYLKILVLFLFTACATVKEQVKITQKKTVFPVYVLKSNDTKRIVRICFPREIEIKNESSKDKSFIKINYEYNSLTTSIGNFIRLYKENDNLLDKISNNKKKIIPAKESIKYIFYTVHYIDKKPFFKRELQSYNKRMLAENKDTLHIGTVTEFKKKHAALFEKLTKGDSISIQFLDDGKFGERVTVPAKW